MQIASKQLATLDLAGFPRVSLRSAPIGGPLLRQAIVTPAYLLVGQDELLLLVHGYANNEAQAFASYKKFLRNVGDPWVARSAGLFWPGDGGPWQPKWWSRFTAPATYPLQPQRAEEAAEYLNDLIIETSNARAEVARLNRRRVRPLTLNIVGHSMGCRLVLELMKLLRSAIATGPAIEVRNVVLMAAAVPDYHVHERGSLEKALSVAYETLVLWSKKDEVLRWAFRAGQSVERPFPLGLRSRTALGRSGTGSASHVSSEETQLGHSDYWPSAAIASKVRGALEGRLPIGGSRVARSCGAGSRQLGTRSLQ
jgi:pimeloyl-ACP methyl ester carboxylesterase